MKYAELEKVYLEGIVAALKTLDRYVQTHRFSSGSVDYDRGFDSGVDACKTTIQNLIRMTTGKRKPRKGAK